VLQSLDATWVGAGALREPDVTVVGLTAPGSGQLGTRTTVRVTLAGSAGRPVRWTEVQVQSRVADRWVGLARTSTDSRGGASVSVPVVDGLQVRAVAASRVSGVATPTVRSTAVVLPRGAPAPSQRVRAQSLVRTAGARPQVAELSGSTWRSMTSRSWRTGCPVGRAGLRQLTESYWGFDGQRHRGTLVVSARTAPRLAMVLSDLYAARQPIRSLRRVETLGGWTTAVRRTLASGSSFGFACQRTPGDPRSIGSHARGRVISLNPWENPTRLHAVGTPDTWWLSRTRSRRYVHARGDAVVRAFAAHGFAWNDRSGRYAEFRDVG
jgi:hypothetical protein